MKKLTVLVIAFLLIPVFSADAAGTVHRKRGAPAAMQKTRPAEPAPSPFTPPPVTRLPVAPDTFRA